MLGLFWLLKERFCMGTILINAGAIWPGDKITKYNYLHGCWRFKSIFTENNQNIQN